MASDQILVNVSIREIPLYDKAVLRDVDGSGGFLRSESPMTVGTLLMLSPARNPELKVPARVQLVVEACPGSKTPGGDLPGMNVTFEAAGEYLLDYREEGPGRARAGAARAAGGPDRDRGRGGGDRTSAEAGSR